MNTFNSVISTGSNGYETNLFGYGPQEVWDAMAEVTKNQNILNKETKFHNYSEVNIVASIDDIINCLTKGGTYNRADARKIALLMKNYGGQIIWTNVFDNERYYTVEVGPDNEIYELPEKFLALKEINISNEMSLYNALALAREGHFVTNEYFDSTQSLHYWNGKYYYEDGAVVSASFLDGQTFATNGNWSIYANKENIDTDKLNNMHNKNKGYMLMSGSYNDCIIKKEKV